VPSEALVPVEGDARLHVDLDGPDDGPLVLFLHGALASGRAFRGQVPALRDRYRVARVDQRGHGKSTHVEEAAWARLDIDVLARDALAVTDALSPRAPAHVVGVSMGGIVAARAASLRGERFASLSLWSAPPRPDPLWMAFFARHPVPTAERALRQADERFRLDAALRARAAPRLARWLAQRP